MRTTTAAAAAAAAAGQMHRCLSRSQDAALYGPSPQIEKSIRQSPAAASKFRLASRTNRSTNGRTATSSSSISSSSSFSFSSFYSSLDRTDMWGRADQWAWPVEWVADQSHGPHLENAFNWTAARMVVLVARGSRGAPLNAAVQPRCCCCCWP
uniref:HDC17998 n=1 Tax=Drosophila melanogaster TaxID=7227 RepID=Q6IIJ1_DROME|nr:TPA_inf: HDC17998 [Drosophila melanogaster]